MSYCKPLINIGEGVIYGSICAGLPHQTYHKKEAPYMVYVLDIDGQPLMPTSRHRKVRKLLNSHLAKVVKRCPFTIQLLYQSTKETQPVSLGVDAGSRHIGLAATTEQKVVYQEELVPRNDVVKLLSARRALRSSRRSRKQDTESQDSTIVCILNIKDGWLLQSKSRFRNI